MQHRFYVAVDQSPDHYYLTQFQCLDSTHETYALMAQLRVRQTALPNQCE